MKAKKHFGQHFLTNADTAKRIVDELGDIENLDVLEIGPGMGIITQFMVSSATRFRAVEIDKDACDFLQKEFPNLEVINEDFLQLNLRAFFTESFSLIGNFPYNISSQIVFKILENSDLVDQWVGMFQLEMGLRLVAKPSDKKQYGILSVLIPFHYKVKRVMELAPGAFNPPPKVHSIVLKATRVSHNWQCDPKLLKRVVKAGFNQRRKTLANSLSVILPKEKLNGHEFATKRPENLNHLEFEQLTVFIENQLKQ